MLTQKYELTVKNLDPNAMFPANNNWSFAISETNKPYMSVFLVIEFDSRHKTIDEFENIKKCFENGISCELISYMPQIRAKIIACRYIPEEPKKLLLWLKDEISIVVLKQEE